MPTTLRVSHLDTTLAIAYGDTCASLASLGMNERETRKEARILLAHITGGKETDVLLYPARPVPPAQQERLTNAISRRMAREPLAYIIEEQEFYGLPFALNAHTLIPRTDTEVLIDGVLNEAHALDPCHILDLGTGSGCILLSLLYHMKHASGIGIDCNDHALIMARQNATRLGLATRCLFTRTHWLDNVRGNFDVVVANPPYIPQADIASLQPEVRVFEPALALDGGADGLDAYRTIIPGIPRVLRPGGLVALEIGIHQQEPVGALLHTHGLRLLSFQPDMGGIMRVVIARMERVKKYQ